MAKCFGAVLLALLLPSFIAAQSASPSQTNNNGTSTAPANQAASPAMSQPGTPRMAPGSVIPVRLTTTLDAKKAKTGEQVTAKVTLDLKTSNGMLLMAKDTEIVGHVTEAQPKNKQDKESQVGIVFDHAVVNGGNVSYPMSIQAVISPQVFQNQNGGNSGNNGAAPSPSSSGQMPSGQMPGGSSRGNMGGGQAAPTNEAPSGGTPQPSGGSQTSSGNVPPAITGHTEGMVGFSHMKLETPSTPTAPSVISSEKSNVKLENGTLMLLRID
jgi:hypothetical protein